MVTAKDEWDAHKEVRKLISEVDELGRLRRMLTSGGDDESADQAVLDDVLYWLVAVQHDPGPLDAYFKTNTQEQAQRYLNNPSIHTPWLTTFILTQLIDAVLEPLHAEATSRRIPFRITSALGWPWNVVVPAMLSFTFFVLAIVAIVLAFNLDLPVVAWLGIAYLMYHYVARFRANYLFAKARGELFQKASRLALIRDEVKSGHYDNMEIARRLREIEASGTQVSSLAFPLLAL